MNAIVEPLQDYLAPTSLAGALAALRAGSVTLLAGGTDLMPQLNAGRLQPTRTLLNLRRIPGLDGVHVEGKALKIGALATISELLENPLVREHAPLLAEAADHFASGQIRNAATLGGNVINASPAGDMLVPLLALDAEVELAWLAADGSPRARRVPIDGFFTGPGATLRQMHELLSAVRVPLAESSSHWSRFCKAGTRPALDISTISIAAAARRGAGGSVHGVRLALGAVAPTPLRARQAEALLEGRALDAALCEQAADCAADEARPIDDVRASAWYRRELLRTMIRRMLDDAART